MDYETLFTEVRFLQKDYRDLRRGLIAVKEFKERLINISILVDYLLLESPVRQASDDLENQNSANKKGSVKNEFRF